MGMTDNTATQGVADSIQPAPSDAGTLSGGSETDILIGGAGEDRLRLILKNKGEELSRHENKDASAEEPWFELPVFSTVQKYDSEIDHAANEYGADPNLVRAIIYMETTHGYYDAPLDVIGVNKSIRPVNVNVDFWAPLGAGRNDLNDPSKNVDIGVRILSEIANRVPDGSIRKIATLQNRGGPIQNPVFKYGTEKTVWEGVKLGLQPKKPRR